MHSIPLRNDIFFSLCLLYIETKESNIKPKYYVEYCLPNLQHLCSDAVVVKWAARG
jgi:hypothetical protein